MFTATRMSICLGAMILALAFTAEPSYAADGAKVFGKCRACHSVDPGKNGVGPSLAGVVGRKAGTADGYSKYKGLKGANWTWTEQEIAHYLKDPSAYTKAKTGSTSSMVLKLTKDDEIAAVIQFLKGK